MRRSIEMKKTTAKTLALLFLVCAFALAGCGTFGKSYEGFYYKEKNGEITITGCKWKQPEHLVIPSKINGKPVTAIGVNALNLYLHYLPGINRAGLPTGVKKWAAFEGEVPEKILTNPYAYHKTAVREKAATVSWEFRKYNEVVPESEIDRRYRGYTYKYLEVIVTFDGPSGALAAFAAYRDKDLAKAGKDRFILSPNKFRLKENYSDDRPVKDWGDSFTALDNWLNKSKGGLLETAETLAKALGDRHIAEPDFDYNQERTYFSDTGPYRTDETGRRYHGFKASYIIYRY